MRYKWKRNGEFLNGPVGFVIGTLTPGEIQSRGIVLSYEKPQTCVLLCGAVVQICKDTRQAKLYVARFIADCAAEHRRGRDGGHP